MDIEYLRDYCLSLEDTSEKMPFGSFAKKFDSILVFYVLDHMFCLIDMDDFRSVTVRLAPEEIEQLMSERTSVSRPVNKSMKNWIQVDFNGDISDSEIMAMVKRSYDIIRNQYTKKSIKRK